MTTAPVSVSKPSFVQALRCRECGKDYPKIAIHVCEFCFGPLEVAYDYAGIGKALTRAVIESRAPTMWRYAELLPLDGPPTVGLQTGMTPLVRADRLAKRLGVRELWIKNDAVSHPTLSFKDRVVSVAISKAIELGIATVACASTGNLANATAAQAAAAGLPAVHPDPVRSRAGARCSAPASTARASSACTGPTTTSTASAPRSPASTAGASSTSTCARSTPRARRATATRSPSSSAGRRRRTSWCRWRAARWSPRSARRSASSRSWACWAARRPAGARRDPRRAGGRLRADRRHGAGEPRPGAPGQEAEQHRQVAGDRKPGRRLLRAPDDHRLGRRRRQARRRRDRRGDAAAGRDRGDLHRDRRRRDAGRGDQAHRAGEDRPRRRTDRHVGHRQWYEDPGSAGRQAAASRC